MPHSSARAPTIGSMMRPGRIQSAATAKPNDRILGGIASERAAKIGGTISTTTPVTAALRITATATFGLRANRVQSAAVTRPIAATKRGTRVALRTKRRVMIRVVSSRPTSCAGAMSAKT
jgi:hypothetical protein